LKEETSMKDEKRPANSQAAVSNSAGSIPNRILGSLRDALNAASRDDRSGEITLGPKTDRPAAGAAVDQPEPAVPPATAVQAASPARPAAQIPAVAPQTPAVSAAAALREAKAPTREHVEMSDPTTRAIRAPAPLTPKAGPSAIAAAAPDAGKTQALRGRQKVVRNAFHQDPVVGWLVVVGGAGLGAFRPIYEGNNSIGRGKEQRIPIDFGDDTISSEEQAYIRYDSMDRSFLFVPNLSKTNIVAVNDKKPTGAVKLELMDVITMGRTQLAFVPFCGDDFDWSELSDLKE
jgi:hypothetical protein